MKKHKFALHCKPSLHSRPLTMIGNIADCFSLHEIHIVHKRARFASSDTVALVLRDIKDQEIIELQVKGKYEAVVLHVMRAVFEALANMPFGIRLSNLRSSPKTVGSYEVRYEEAARQLYDLIGTTIKESIIPNQADILAATEETLGLSDKCRVVARLNYSKGMHVLPSQIIRELRCCIPETHVVLLYIRSDGEVDSVDDIFNTLDLCTTAIENGQQVTIKSFGKGSAKAAYRIKFVFDHMEETVARREKVSGSWGESHWDKFFKPYGL